VTIVAVGASTGGANALPKLLAPMPPDAPPILVVQHLPEGYARPFAERLNRLCRVEVREARDGDDARAGRVLVAPANRHMLLRRRDDRYTVEVCDGPPFSRHRPSIDLLFRSVAAAAGRDAVGVLLSGMGDDGAAGLAEMRRAGAVTLAQDESSCVVSGVPRHAIERNAVDATLPLHRLPREILSRLPRSAS